MPVESRAAQIEISAPSYLRHRISREKLVTAMAAAGGVSSDDVPILQAENLTSNVKSIYYRSLSLSSSRFLPTRSIRSGGAPNLVLGLIWI